MSMRMELPESKYPTPESRRAFYDRLAPRLASLPGVDSVALTTSVPPFGAWRREMRDRGTPGAQGRRKRRRRSPSSRSVPGFFDTVGVSDARSGRGFTETDGAPGHETAIINERTAVAVLLR